MSSFSILLVAPRSIFRDALVRILCELDDSMVTAGSSVAEISLDQVPRDQPVLLLIELGSDRSALFGEIELFKKNVPTGHIALLADREELVDEEIIEAFQAGAHAYFVKPNCENFIKCLELVALGEIILPPQLVSFVLRNQQMPSTTSSPTPLGDPTSEVDDHSFPKLSLRETCILRCLISGDSNKVIARNYSIAEATVKVHVKAILRKIRVRNRTQAAIWALNNHSSMGSTNDRLLAAPTNGHALSPLPLISDPAGTAAAILIGQGRSQV
jgi:two-component system nitrate/nitrite response regulator NarL